MKTYTRKEIIQIIDSGRKGYHTGSRMILPFTCNIIKLIADGHIVTEFVGNAHVKLSQDQQNTSIYFREMGRLSQFSKPYQLLKLIIAPAESDLTDRNQHIKVICKILDNHEVELESITEDVLFIS